MKHLQHVGRFHWCHTAGQSEISAFSRTLRYSVKCVTAYLCLKGSIGSEARIADAHSNTLTNRTVKQQSCCKSLPKPHSPRGHPGLINGSQPHRSKAWMPAMHRLGRCDPLPCGPSSLNSKLYSGTLSYTYTAAQLELKKKADNLESCSLAYQRTFILSFP